MANNKVSSLLNVDMPKPKTSNFNLGRVNRFTADVGWTIPCYTEEILPNSYKRLDVEGLIQTNATVAPLMGTFKVKIDAFFVPLRLYYPHLDLNNIRPGFTDNFDYHYIALPSVDNSTITETNQVIESNPGISRGYVDGLIGTTTYHFYTGYSNDDVATVGVSPSSLIDYLGLMPANFSPLFFTNTPVLNANPLLAYFDIWRNYYSNPHDPLVPFRVRNRINDDDVDQRINVGLDKFIKLEQFDYLFSDILRESITPTNEPVALDVYDFFKKHLRFNIDNDNDLSNDFYHVPFFANELVLSDVDGGPDSATTVEFLPTSNGLHFGLLPRTYQDDYFNSRFRNDFVAYVEERSKLTVENNEIYISQLRLQNRTAKYVDKSIFSDTRFGAWVKAHFGVKTNQKLNIPQFLGSITTNIVFNDIYATAQTGDGGITQNQALGSRSSLGQGYLKNKGSFIEFKATEPGYLMCMFSIIPQVSYFQGIKKMYLKTSFNDMYKPEFDAVGYDDLQTAELSVIPYYAGNTTLNDRPMDFQTWNKSVGKHPAWLEYMTSFDEAHGLMTKRNEFGYWLLNRPFTPNAYDENQYALATDFNASTYIRPEYFNTIFAVDKFTDNFQVQLRFYDKTKQPISKQILPHL